jgi:hypothetical protein
MQDAKKINNSALQEEGLLSERVQATTTHFNNAVKEMEIIRAEAFPDFDPEWFPTRAYMAFGPSLDDPHGHGGYLSPHNGTCISKGPLTDVDLGGCVLEKGLKRARERAIAKSKNAPSSPSSVASGGKLSNDRSDADGNAHSGGNVTARLMAAIEKQLDISHEWVRQ